MSILSQCNRETNGLRDHDVAALDLDSREDGV